MKENTSPAAARDNTRENPETSPSVRIDLPEVQSLDNNDQLAQEVGRDPLDPFDPANLRIDTSYLNERVAKKLLLEVPIRPPKSQDFIRVHPSLRLTPAALIKLKDGGEYFLVHKSILEKVDEVEYFLATLFLYVNKQKVPAFWPVRLPDPDGDLNQWHKSAGNAVQYAMKTWVRIIANKSLGGYDVHKAVSQYVEPEWSDLPPFPELLKLAFQDRIVESLDHPAFLKLRGQA